MSEVTSGPLRAALDSTGLLPRHASVLARQNDPFRVDTPAGHANGAWLAEAVSDLLGDRRIHLRGLHYLLLGRPRPGQGAVYANDETSWSWLVTYAGKAARWLGYVPWGQVLDARNDAPEVREFTRPAPQGYLAEAGAWEVELPPVADFLPTVETDGFTGVQPYHLVMFGEKTSLHDDLRPVAAAYQADLYLPHGEISDTLLATMADSSVRDGRSMVVLCFSDCDPAGWQMPVSIARKLQAFAALDPAMPEFEVYRVALTPEQVRAEGLPDDPVKESEKRAAAWRAAMGTEATEIDSLAALRPGRLRQIAREAIAPFYDPGLSQRVRAAEQEWERQAQAVLEAHLGDGELDRLRDEAEARLAAVRADLEELGEANAGLVSRDDLDLPPAEVPEATVPGGHGLPLLDSRWPFAEQTQRLIESRAYLTGEAA